ncbi:unnamed protein product [Auanema sp. JU1783]|nr:unnamed protein product [Auanema sp. JU1783]
MPSCGSPSSQLSCHSDYGTCSVASSDEDVVSNVQRTAPGICPHCQKIFVEPMTLQCGHSLCYKCIQSLLAQQAPFKIRRNKIRMGINSCHMLLDRSMTAQSSQNDKPIIYQSPRCIVCGEGAKSTPPVPNLELKYFLESIKNSKQTTYVNPAYREEEEDVEKKIRFSDYDTDEDRSFSIRDCKIAVMGSVSVGKTSLRRVQYGNEILFTDILGHKGGDDDINNTCMIDIIDGDNSDHDIETADGFILVYSITDRESFYAIRDIYTAITERRAPNVPIVLVGTKADNWRKRKVESYEGQDLSRFLNCPFLEVSSKRNDNVNESFVELMRIVERQRLL